MSKKKYQFIISILLINLVSCQSLNYALEYNGTSQQGKHARGVDVEGNRIIVTGKDGAITFFDMSSNYIKIKDSIPEAEDLRDVHLFRDLSYILLNSGELGAIYYSSYGEIVQAFQDETIFLNGFGFWENENEGIAFGDQREGKLLILKTVDKGKTWYDVVEPELPNALKNEGGFAASGTSIDLVSDSVVYIGTGMSDTARLYKSTDKGVTWITLNTPMESKENFGIYSIDFWDANSGIIIGGSYKDSSYNEKIAFYSNDGGVSWANISDGLPGYMSCVSSSHNGKLIFATGKSGIYYSFNKGKKWIKFSSNSFYTVKLTDDLIILSGKNGRLKIYKYSI